MRIHQGYSLWRSIDWANVPLGLDKIGSLVHNIISSTKHRIVLFDTEKYMDAATKKLLQIGREARYMSERHPTRTTCLRSEWGRYRITEPSNDSMS